MNNCLQASDLVDLGASAVTTFQSRIESIPNDMCAPFNGAAHDLEIEMLAFYRVAALCAKRSSDLNWIASLWETMARICNDASKELETLHKKHPMCGAKAYQDKLSDLRNKCQRLQQMHS